MAKAPWLTIIGLGEDGPDGLPPASHCALERAEIIIGAPRHLSLLPNSKAKHVEWVVPFQDGIAILLNLRGRKVVMLTSGDPFWFGAGSVIARHLDRSEWRTLPGVSTFSLAAAHLGWPLEQTPCFGLHAAPLARLRPHLAPGWRAIVLLRDGAAVSGLASWLDNLGFGATVLHVMEALGGARARTRTTLVAGFEPGDIVHPVCVGLEVKGTGPVVGLATGRADVLFENDGQITKRPVRALTLSALAPRYGEHLWDIGGGSGSVAIEWLLSHPSTRATVIEARDERVVRIRRNADHLGVDRLHLVTGEAPAILTGLTAHDLPDAVFIGGGLSDGLLAWLAENLTKGTRLVANSVTLESTALLGEWQARLGGTLLKIELAHSSPLGSKRTWKPSLPLVQWSVVL
ncbi:MAG: precorrin-6y C5,15-methyltransferase (decarboxylating) subunit CbiE [Rhodobacteraceae bacterium]|nr:precorrin-6y C5,15-methyltransferase (decarboxylating) subunit CbiE [Paracoccaceae bacterium]